MLHVSVIVLLCDGEQFDNKGTYNTSNLISVCKLGTEFVCSCNVPNCNVSDENTSVSYRNVFV